MIKRYRKTQYQDYLAKLFPEKFCRDALREGEQRLAHTVTFKVTEDCNLKCTYCYQTHKTPNRMSFETAKKFADYLLDAAESDNEYINKEVSPGVIIEFIGGEPFLEIDLIERICDYMENQMILRQHPWLEYHRYSVCTNGINYFSPKVQKFINRYQSLLSLNITLDGNKQIHDACRVFPDGSPSYDIVIEAVKHTLAKHVHTGSKITISPENIEYTHDAIVHMVELGIREINANCIFEEGWDNSVHPAKLYEQLKKTADYFIKHDIVESVYCSLFEEDSFRPLEENDNQNWCGGNGIMLACDHLGDLYPCIRYMESSLDGKQPPMRIGDIENGIGCSKSCKSCIQSLKEVTRKSQSADECWGCVVAKGCAWCSAYNYQLYGTVNKRATFICHMHKARALANVYFWNIVYRKKGMQDRMTCYLSYEQVSHIISKEEYELLIYLSKKKENEG